MDKNFFSFINIKSLFFENKTIKQTVAKNTFWLALSELFYRLSEAFLIIYMIRVLGAGEFGKFSFALAFASIFIAFSGLGLSDIFTRELSHDKTVEKEYPAILSLKLILGIVIFLLAVSVSFIMTGDPATRLMIASLTVYYFVNDFFAVIYAFLRAFQKMEYEAGFKILRSFIMVAIIFLIIYKSPSVKNISLGYLLANLLALILVLLIFNFKIHKLKISFDKNVWLKFLSLSWPLALAAIFSAISVNFDSVLMGYTHQIVQNGWYNAARKMAAIIIIPGSLIFMSFYPVFSKLFKESKIELQRVANQYIALMVLFAFPVVAGGFIIAPKLISLVYGSNLGPSILIFRILIFLVGINFVYYPYALILIAGGKQKKYLWAHLSGAIINIALNMILIPIYGPYGAAISAVATFSAMLLLMVVFSKYSVKVSVFNLRLSIFSGIVILSSLIMSIIISQPLIYQINIFYLMVIGAVIYIAVFLFFYKCFQKFSFNF